MCHQILSGRAHSILGPFNCQGAPEQNVPVKPHFQRMCRKTLRKLRGRPALSVTLNFLLSLVHSANINWAPTTHRELFYASGMSWGTKQRPLLLPVHILTESMASSNHLCTEREAYLRSPGEVGGHNQSSGHQRPRSSPTITLVPLLSPTHLSQDQGPVRWGLWDVNTQMWLAGHSPVFS